MAERIFNIVNETMKHSAKKDAEYYLNLDYPTVVHKLTEAQGGGWMASIPQLGSSTFVGDGETREAALEALDNLRAMLIPELLERGVELPEPQNEEDDRDNYSGSLMLRVSKRLHAQLAAAAKRNNVSINKLATEFLSRSLGTYEGMDMMEEAVKRALQLVPAEMPLPVQQENNKH